MGFLSKTLKFTPLDIGTYLVASRTRPNECHLISLLPDEYYGCSCEGYEFTTPWNWCSHFDQAMRRRQAGKLPMIIGMRGRTQ